MNWRDNVITKKGFKYLNHIRRHFLLPFVTIKDYENRPPILVNSFPKSGTHLLMQIVESLPDHSQYGNFLASTPSFSFKEVDPKRMAQSILKILPGEIVGGHIHCSEEVKKAISQINCFHLFIFRDARDVTVSEAYYLGNMNRWHKMSKHFRALSTDLDRVKLSLYGMPDKNIDYPNVCERFAKYSDWLGSDNVICFKYEDFISARREECLTLLVDKYLNFSKRSNSKSQLLDQMRKSIDPTKSHTFRSGKDQQWKKYYTNEMSEDFEKMSMKRKNINI
ncbi:MAG: sulfotransferase domain-containing protein [Reichenbachiella sp.]